MQKNPNIEVEFRSELTKAQFDSLNERFRKDGKLKSKTRRLSVMIFGDRNGINVDIRIRITNGQSEVVIKKGEFHAHNKFEECVDISKDQFMPMVKMFSAFDFYTKIGERETINYSFENDIVVSIVKAKKIFYIEYEKLSNKDDEEKDTKDLLEFISKYDTKIIDKKEDYVKLLDKLQEDGDWVFKYTQEDYKKLEERLNEY